MYRFNNQDIKTQLHEMTVNEFEKALEILNLPDLLPIEKYLQVIKLLGASEDTLNEMTNEDFFEIIGEFNKSRKGEEAIELPRTIEHEGYIYEAYPEGEEFKIPVRKLAMLEKVFSMPGEWYSNMLSILFKRPEHSYKEHFSEVNIKKRLKVFKELPAHTHFGYITKVSEMILNNASQNND